MCDVIIVRVTHFRSSKDETVLVGGTESVMVGSEARLKASSVNKGLTRFMLHNATVQNLRVEQ